MSEPQTIVARHLILGMSHSGAIWWAHQAANDADDFLVIPLTGKFQAVSADVVQGHIQGADPARVRSLFLALYGNTYNAFAMMERVPPIWTETASGECVPADKSGRNKMRRAAIRKALLKGLAPVRQGYAEFRAAYPKVAIFAIAPPPPIFDAEHIRTYPGAFARILDQGVAPASLRLAIYDIQMDIVREMAAREAISIIPPPPESITSEGGLAPEYWNRDPTHGNRAYGRLVFAQIREAAGALAD